MVTYTPQQQIGRELALQVGREVGLPDAVALALVGNESNFNADAVGPVTPYGQAIGYTQSMPATAANPGYGVQPWNPHDPLENMRGGLSYYKALLDLAGGDYQRAAAMFNWGPGNVQNWDGNPETMPEETRNYVQAFPSTNAGEPLPQSIIDAVEADNLLDEPRTSGKNLMDEVAVEDPLLTIMEENEGDPEGTQFHPGLFLQNLGAAMAATAQGQSAASDFEANRRGYFAQRKAQTERADEEAERQRQLDMQERLLSQSAGVFADHPDLARAVAAGLDPADAVRLVEHREGVGTDTRTTAQKDYDRYLQIKATEGQEAADAFLDVKRRQRPVSTPEELRQSVADEARIGRESKQIESMIEAEPKDRQMMAAIQEMEAIIAANPDLTTGPLTENNLVAFLDKASSQLGLELSGSDARERLRSLHAQVFPGLRPVGSGATSDWEGSIYALAFPGPGNTPEVFKAQLAFQKNRLQREQAYRDFVQATYNGVNNTMADVKAAWDAKVANGDIDTVPLYINVDTFSDGAMRRMGGFHPNQIVYMGDEAVKLTAEDAADLNRRLNSGGAQ